MAPTKTTIASQLFRRVFLFYILSALLLATVLVVNGYHNTLDKLLDEAKQLEAFHKGEIARQLWLMEVEQLDTVVSTMLQTEPIAKVKIEDTHQEILLLSEESISRNPVKRLFSKQYRQSFPIYYTHEMGVEQMGQLTLYTAQSAIIGRIQYHLLLLAGTGLIMIAALWLILFYVSRTLLTQPLNRLTLLSQQVDLSNLYSFNHLKAASEDSELGQLESAFLTMLHRLEIASDKNEAEHELNNQIYQETPVGIAVYHENGQCVTANRALGEIIDATHEQVMQQNFHQLDSWKGSGLYDAALQALRSGEIQNHDTQLDSTFGNKLYLESRLIPLTMKESQGELMVVMHDVSLYKKAEIQLQRFNQTLEEKVEQRTQQLEAAMLAKDEFLASMSHELRTPLTTIIGNGEILGESPLTEDQRNLLIAMDLSSNNLLSLINDILDLSKIEADKFEIDYAPFDLTVLLEEVGQMFSVPARDSGLAFEINQQTTPSHQIWGDGRRIGQILINLIGNAIKFTEKGRVAVTSWVDDSLYFSVEDSGIGITPEVIKRLFTPFVQADNSISRRYGGTGLGLHISQSLAKTMEGHIEVTSVVGKGSRFLLKLPYRESELLPQLPSNSGRDIASSVLQENFEGEVLIVEDTPELQRLERRILESVGATVTVVNNGEEAISMAGQQNFDLILMDMQMPIMGGLEATAQLRQQGNQTPIVALTANVMQKHKDQFNQVGANGFLQKPINKNELLRTLKIYLTPSQSPPTPNTSPDTAPTPLYGQPPYPLLVIDDDENILKLYQTVFEGEEEKELLMSDLEEIIGETAPYPLEKEFTLSLANQGKMGVEIAHHALQRGRPFPVAFIDMRMPPGMDGLETAKALRKLDERIYIVIVTAYTDHDPREIDRQLGGGVLYLQKPFSQQEIQQIARMFVDKWIKEHNPEEVAIENSVVKAVVKTQESGKESENMGAAPDFSEEEVDDELMAIFRESSRKNREKLTAALADKEWSEVRSVAHSIKGSATSFGYPGLSRMAESVQFAIDDERVDELPVLVMELLTDMGKMLSGTSNNALS